MPAKTKRPISSESVPADMPSPTAEEAVAVNVVNEVQDATKHNVGLVGICGTVMMRAKISNKSSALFTILSAILDVMNQADMEVVAVRDLTQKVIHDIALGRSLETKATVENVATFDENVPEHQAIKNAYNAIKETHKNITSMEFDILVSKEYASTISAKNLQKGVKLTSQFVAKVRGNMLELRVAKPNEESAEWNNLSKKEQSENKTKHIHSINRLAIISYLNKHLSVGQVVPLSMAMKMYFFTLATTRVSSGKGDGMKNVFGGMDLNEVNNAAHQLLGITIAHTKTDTDGNEVKVKSNIADFITPPTAEHIGQWMYYSNLA